MPRFALLFLAALAATLLVRLWLSLRHAAFVAAHRGTVPAFFADHIPLAAHQKAADYTIAHSRLGRISAIVDAAVLLALSLGGVLAALDAFWQTRLSGLGYGLALIGSVVLLTALVDLPLSLYRQFVIEARFQFNRMTPALFFADLAKQALIAAILGIPLIAAVLGLMAAMGRYWWLYAWGFWCAFNLFLLYVYPIWIAPWFNRFSPLPEGETRTRVEALLARCGFRSNGLFVMDGSKRSRHGNAYFTGLGNKKRIVFFDTLLERLQPTEIEAVLAHELGHFRCRHVVKRLLLMFGLALGFLGLLGQLIHSPAFYAGLGVPGATGNTAMALVLFALVVPVFAFPFSPLMSFLSRRDEFEADAYAVRHARAEDLARALVKLYEDNAATLTPDPLHSLFYDSHPPALARIRRFTGLPMKKV